jgi:transposase
MFDAAEGRRVGLPSFSKRKSPKLVAVALANKRAHIAWKLMVTGENYVAKSAPAALAGAG